MSTNPWLVDSIEMFLYLNCPECVFLTKEKTTFKNHALEKHPLSSAFFGESSEDKNLELNSTANQDTDNEKSPKVTIIEKFKAQCYICKENFRKDSNMLRHFSQVHAGKKPYGCNNCSATFSRRQILIRHISKTHEIKKVTCNSPKAKSIQDFDLPAYDSDEDDQNTKESMMLEEFESDIDNIMDKDENQSPRDQNLKTISFSKRNELNDSIQLSKIKFEDLNHDANDEHDQNNECNEKKFNCSGCENSFSKKQQLNSHFASVHDGKELYQCSRCEASYTTQPGLNYHFKKFHKEKSVEISQGKTNIATKGNEKSPKVTIIEKFKAEPKVEELLQKRETLCEMNFNYQIELEDLNLDTNDEHQNEQDNECNEKKFNCFDCENSFSKKQQLNSHFASVHKGKELYECSKCDASYTTQPGLNYHFKKFHTDNEKSHKITISYITKFKAQCYICKENFRKDSDMLRHFSQVHEGKKPYGCSNCSATFSRKQILIRHISKDHEITRSERAMKREFSCVAKKPQNYYN